MKRRRMNRGYSKRAFRANAGVHKRNVVSGAPMRGGIRL